MSSGKCPTPPLCCQAASCLRDGAVQVRAQRFVGEVVFHSRGVSSATREAGCWPMRCSTSTKYVYGSTPCSLHVTIRLCTMPACLAPTSVQQNNQLRRPIGIARSARSMWFVSIGTSASPRNTSSPLRRSRTYASALVNGLLGNNPCRSNCRPPRRRTPPRAACCASADAAACSRPRASSGGSPASIS